MAQSKYESHVKDKLILVEGWARDGLTDEQIAENLGIVKSTFYKYKDEHSDFSNALKKGKEVSDYMVENALFKKALGYQYEEVTYEAIKIGDGDHEVPAERIRTVVKEAAPDTTAQIYWLKNRRPDKWRDKPDTYEKLKKLIGLLAKLNLTEDEVNELVNGL